LVVLTGLQLLRAHNRLHLEPDAHAAKVFDDLLEEGRRIGLRIQSWLPEQPPPGTYYDVFGEGGAPDATILVLTFPESTTDGHAHRDWQRTGDHTWVVKGVQASSVPSRQVYAVAAPAEFAERMRDWGDRWHRSKMSKEVRGPDDLRHNIEELLKGGPTPRIEVSEPKKVLVEKRPATS
jgi:hypothetical protein